MVRVQVKVYRKKYQTERKGNYICKQYYLYLPKRFGERLLGKELSIIERESALIIQPNDT